MGRGFTLAFRSAVRAPTPNVHKIFSTPFSRIDFGLMRSAGTLLKKDVVVAASNMPLCNFLSAIMPTECPDCPLYNPLSFAPYIAAMESYRIMLMKRQTLHPPPQEVFDDAAGGDVTGAAGKKTKGAKTKQ